MPDNYGQERQDTAASASSATLGYKSVIVALEKKTRE